MQIIYRYYGDWDSEQIKIMSHYGINLELGADSFEIEKGKKHDDICEHLKKWGFIKNRGVNTIYDKRELNEVDILVYTGSWTNGYPQPEETREWMFDVYDTTGFCSECGCGCVQKAPFKIRRPVNWKNKHVFDLEWVHDEMFVKKEIYEQLFKPLGVCYWPVLLFKKDIILEDTVQLKIPEIAANLDLNNQRYEICGKCGRKKFINQFEGYFPGFINNQTPNIVIAKSTEYCGTGHMAFKWILLSQELRKKMTELGIRAKYMPVKK
jgi:hypothetical protein